MGEHGWRVTKSSIYTPLTSKSRSLFTSYWSSPADDVLVNTSDCGIKHKEPAMIAGTQFILLRDLYRSTSLSLETTRKHAHKGSVHAGREGTNTVRGISTLHIVENMFCSCWLLGESEWEAQEVFHGEQSLARRRKMSVMWHTWRSGSGATSLLWRRELVSCTTWMPYAYTSWVFIEKLRLHVLSEFFTPWFPCRHSVIHNFNCVRYDDLWRFHTSTSDTQGPEIISAANV